MFQTVEVEFGLYYGLLFQKLLLKTVADKREGIKKVISSVHCKIMCIEYPDDICQIAITTKPRQQNSLSLLWADCNEKR